jgi:hypothetical protein
MRLFVLCAAFFSNPFSSFEYGSVTGSLYLGENGAMYLSSATIVPGPKFLFIPPAAFVRSSFFTPSPARISTGKTT